MLKNPVKTMHRVIKWLEEDEDNKVKQECNVRSKGCLAVALF